MNTKILFPCLLALLFASSACTSHTTQDKAAAAANKTVSVAFTNPEKFTDLKTSQMDSDKDRDYLMEQLKEYIVERATMRMADNQTLAVTIKDVDMAGDYEPHLGPRLQDVRIIKDIYPPRIDLDFKLTDAGGRVLAEGTRELRDLSFMMSITPTTQSDILRYEKRLLDDWLANEFAALNKK